MARTARKERELERIRHDIVRAAAEVAMAEGPEGLTLKAIAASSGYTVKTLYSYFDGKDAILKAMGDQVLGLMLPVLRVPLPHGLTLRQKIEFLVGQILVVMDGSREMLLALVTNTWAYAQLGAAGPPADIGHRRLHEWFSANTSPEELHGQDPRELSLFVIGVFQAVVNTAAARNPNESLIALQPRILQLIFHGLALPDAGERGISPSPS